MGDRRFTAEQEAVSHRFPMLTSPECVTLAWDTYSDMVARIAGLEVALSEAQLALSQMVSREMQRESSKEFMRGIAAAGVYRG